MRALKNHTGIDHKILVKKPEAQALLSLGETALMREAEAAGAVVRVGRSVLIDVEKLRKHLTAKPQ